MFVRVRIVCRWRVSQIYCYLEGLLHHIRNDPIEKAPRTVKAGVRIDLDEPRLEVAIYHKIQSKNLEVVELVFGGYFGVDTSGSISGHCFHLG